MNWSEQAVLENAEKNERKFDTTSIDSTVWAREFVKVLKQHPDIVEEDCMIGWFANAIMAGYDNARKN